MGGDVEHPLVVLAAGRSTRMGRPKGLVVVEGRSWIERQLAAFAACGGRRAIVVLGHARDEYAAALPWVNAANASEAVFAGLRVTVAVNEDPDRGPFSSLQVGVRAALADAPVTRAVFVLPIDVPAPDARVWTALAARLAAGVDACIPVFEARGGHPVLCGDKLLQDIVATAVDAPDARLDAKLRACTRVARVDVDDARVTWNLNTEADWALLTPR